MVVKFVNRVGKALAHNKLENMNLKIKKLSDKAIIPSRANNGDAGLDLYSTEDYILRPLERHLFKTDISMEIPEGYYGRIADRSGNAYKKGLHCLAGVIDEIFRGNIGVVLINLNHKPYREYNGDGQDLGFQPIGEDVEIKAGDKIAQIVLEKYYIFPVVEVDKLNETVRGEKGYGSSGA